MRQLEWYHRSQPMCLVVAAGGASVCIFLKTSCAWRGGCVVCVCVFTGNLQAGPAGKQGNLRSGLGYQVGRGSVLVFGGDLIVSGACGMSV